MKIGYVRVSSSEQNPILQLDALQKAGCEKIYQEKKSAFKERPELKRALQDLRVGDVLCVWSLDRLGRSMKEIRSNIDLIQEKGADLQDITHNIDTSTSSGKFLIPFFFYARRD
ncbi:recombinase family protein [Bacteroides fragilis]